MRIVLFRHGPAAERDPRRWPDDKERPLTLRGVGKTREAARGLRLLDLGVDRVFTSPLRRAAQTAKELEQALGGKPAAEVLEALAPEKPAREVFSALTSLDPGSTIVLVGHEPQLGALAASLVIGSARSSIPLNKAGACLIAFENGLTPGGGELVWLLPRKLLRRLGEKGKKSK